MTVAEALYKRTLVVASNIGRIPLQVIDGVNGFLNEPTDVNGFSGSIITLLRDEKLREEFGRNGKEYVKNDFLITRLMLNWLDLFERIFKCPKKSSTQLIIPCQFS
ncbi:MAG: glycosyltransferase [Candidatus Methanofastidiosia archaeon]